LLRGTLRALGSRFPGLRRYSGRLGLGRLAAPASTREQIRLDGDIVIEIDLSVPIFRYIYYHHDLSKTPEAELIRRLINSGDTFVDVGAHIGYWTLLAAKYAAHVLAFEPSSATFAYLQRNLDLNPGLACKIAAHPIALSDRSDQDRLYRPISHPDEASLRPLDAPDVVVELVQTDTLDHMVSDVRCPL
jgi:FkbM family methyltransferase